MVNELKINLLSYFSRFHFADRSRHRRPVLAGHREPRLEGGSGAVPVFAPRRRQAPAGLGRQGADGDRDARRCRSYREHQEVLYSRCQNEDETFVSHWL